METGILFSSTKGSHNSLKTAGLALDLSTVGIFSRLFIIPLACGSPPCKQRGELFIAVIEQLFLLLHFSCPLSQGGRDSLLSGGGWLFFLPEPFVWPPKERI